MSPFGMLSILRRQHGYRLGEVKQLMKVTDTGGRIQAYLKDACAMGPRLHVELSTNVSAGVQWLWLVGAC